MDLRDKHIEDTPQNNPAHSEAAAVVTEAAEAAAAYRAKAQDSKQELKKSWLTFLKTGVFVVALVVVLVFTLAWFVNTNIVKATGMAATPDDDSVSLFIAKGDTPDYKWETDVSMTLYGSLYPSSSLDCSNWYCDSVWDDADEYVTGYRKVTDITYVDKETGSRVALFDASGSTTNVALYNVSTYALYTSKDGTSLDVYLDETAPIVVSYTGEQGNRDLLSALRIGVCVGDTLQFVYIPNATESEAGNSSGTVAGKYYAVKGTETSDLSSNGDSDFYTFYTDDTIETITAAKSESGSSYTASSDHVKICEADYDGTVIKVYAWLEGTDSDALLGTSDGDMAGISVKLNFAGVATT